MDIKHQVNCSYTNKSSLYQAYMPFVKGGGLFIHMQPVYQLGTLINLSLKLMDEAELYQVECSVVWITSKGAQDSKNPGIGVQFLGEKGCFLADKIETYLAGMLESTQVTDTM